MATVTLTTADISPWAGAPANVSVLTYVILCGAGGNGGAASGSEAGAGGGGGGCTALADQTHLTIDFSIAAGGSELDTEVTINAVVSSAASGTNAVDNTPGTSGVGDTYDGGSGAAGEAFSDGKGGGGGGGAWYNAAGSPGGSGSGSWPNGGASVGGASGAGGTGGNQFASGANGAGFGGGGGGGSSWAGFEAAGNGGDGGIVIVYYPDITVTSLDVDVGGINGGTNVTITGDGFTDATGATFGGVAATSFVVVNDTTITCTTPAHAAGAVDVAVANPVRDGTLTDGFTYYDAPSVSSVGPAFDDVDGGADVTITGTGFTGATSATLRGVAITSFTVVNDTTITGVAGASENAGSGDVQVFNPVFNGLLEDGWTYYPVPAPTSVSPNYGATAGGTSVTITGSGFWGSTSVEFDGDPATNFAVVDDEHITCDTPAHVAATVDVEVINPATSGTKSNGFTFSDTPPAASGQPTDRRRRFAGAIID